MNGIKGKSILITGASSGIGAAIAKAFANNGARVGIHYSKNHEGALAVAQEISDNNVKIYQQDFSLDCLDLVHKFVNDFGKIDVLINNAGTTTSIAFDSLTIQEYDRIFKINSRSSFILAKDALNYMKKQPGGRIINISSVSTRYGRGRNNSIQYAASKATLDILTKGLSVMGAPYNILVNSISPGIILTRIHDERPNFEHRMNLIPIKRGGTPDDVANLALFLASDKGNFITGEVFTVAGGE